MGLIVKLCFKHKAILAHYRNGGGGNTLAPSSL